MKWTKVGLLVNQPGGNNVMKLRKKGKTLEQRVNDRWLLFAEFDDEVRLIKILKNKGVVVRTEQGGKTKYLDRNIFFLNEKGKIIWRVEKPDRAGTAGYRNIPNPFNGFSFRSGKLLAYTQAGFEYEVNLKNGKLKYLGFSKC